jgi:heat shock protein HslJ
MRPIETILLLANLLTFTVLVVPRLRAVSWTGYLALIALLIAGAQALVEGLRWQMVPTYVLSGLFFLIWLGRNMAPAGRFAGRLVTGLAIGLGVLGLAVSIALPIALPVFRFPHPGGPYAIGTLTYHWVDADRPEVFNTDPDARRELMVQIWYPAKGNPSSPHAPYIQDAAELTPALGRLLNLPAFTFNHFRYVTTHAIPSAPVADDEPSYPVLIFLEGFTGFRQMNTFQVEALVSHGYVVAAIDQPYAATQVVFPDGRQVAGLSREQMQVLVQQSLNPVKEAPILNGRRFEDGIIPYLAQDAIFTLDQLAALNQSDPNGILTGRLDLQRAGTFGISLGGIVGSEACRLEPRLKACLVMDAPMPEDVVRIGLQQPGMWITRDAETMRLERKRAGGWSEADIREHQTTMRAVYESLPGEGYFVNVPGMFHANLTDVPDWSPLTSRLGITGPIDGQRVHRIINAYSLAFFDRHLKGYSTALLDSPGEQYSEVLFETRRPGSLANTDERQGSQAEQSLANTNWRLVSSGEVGAETPVVAGSTITLEFDSEGQASGSGGCNTYGAQYAVQENTLSFDEITRTLRACAQEGLGQQEERFFQALETSDRFEQAGDRLTIWYQDGNGVLKFVRLGVTTSQR